MAAVLGAPVAAGGAALVRVGGSSSSDLVQVVATVAGTFFVALGLVLVAAWAVGLRRRTAHAPVLPLVRRSPVRLRAIPGGRASAPRRRSRRPSRPLTLVKPGAAETPGGPEGRPQGVPAGTPRRP